jgi:predicted nucleic acid-binding protein
VAERRHVRGLIDTSVVIDLEVVDVERLPREVAVSAMTMSDLAAGPHTTADLANERAVRTDSDAPSQRSNRCLSMRGWRVRTAVCAQSALPPAAKARRRRTVDLFIAATVPSVLWCRPPFGVAFSATTVPAGNVACTWCRAGSKNPRVIVPSIVNTQRHAHQISSEALTTLGSCQPIAYRIDGPAMRRSPGMSQCRMVV